MIKPLSDLERQIEHEFQDKTLIELALTHSSVSSQKNYERLEFLGDRVLGLIVAEHLYKRFPKEDEGAMAKRLAALVQGSLLAEIAIEMNLGDYIKFSDAEAAAGGAENKNILSDVFESMLGALYLDAGFEPCRILVESHWEDRFDKMTTPPQHPKTTVQEWAQSKGLELPEYEIIAQTGPDHAPEFLIRLTVEGYAPVESQGNARSTAEKQAAIVFMEKMKI